MAPYTYQAEDEMGHAAEPVDSRSTFSLNLSEDAGEAVGRTISSNPTDVGTHPVLAFDIYTGSERGRVVEKRLQERGGAALDTTKATDREMELPQPKASAAIAGLESYTPSAPIKRQRQRKPVNAIDDLFQRLH